MKTNYILLRSLAVGLLFTAASWGQTTLVGWNFNGTSDTTVPGGPTSPTPSVGAGSAQLVGGTTAIFSSGNSTVGTQETQTTSPPNFGWGTTTYPAAGQAPKTAGAQFNVSTVGYSGIVFNMEQRQSNSSANTYVVQYTANRTAATPVWVDAMTFSVTPAATGTGDTWYNNRVVNVETVTALDNNPNVAFRVVSAFDPTANDYVASKLGTTYGGGTVRFDSVTIKANVVLAVPQFDAAREFTISPNPSHNQTVNFNIAQDINVFDALGKLILSKKDAMSIDTQSFHSGIYFIKTSTGISKKLIVE